jgi:hypothetical protein
MDQQRRAGTPGSMIRQAGIVLAALLAASAFAGTALASSDASVLPPSWHIHDGQIALGPQHKGVGFFPAVLGGIPVATYLEDPARCPNATDKAFLPSWDTTETPLLRAGICTTDAVTINLRTVPVGTEGPQGWSSITVATEPGWVTYYKVVNN